MLAPTLTLIAFRLSFWKAFKAFRLIPLFGRSLSELSFLRCFSFACVVFYLCRIVSEFASGIFGKFKNFSFLCSVRQLLNMMSNCVIIAQRAICTAVTQFILRYVKVLTFNVLTNV